MREIKFRAWHKSFSPELEEDGMGRINGMYQVKGIWMSNSFQKYVDLNNFTMGCVDLWGWKSSCKVNEVHLMQSSEIRDKKGKEIYEGDILKNQGIIGKVVFFEGCFKIQWNNMAEPLFDWFIVSNCPDLEIIGNIYQNEELLKGGNNETN